MQKTGETYRLLLFRIRHENRKHNKRMIFASSWDYKELELGI
jgi:hypothetical protein